MNLNRRRATLAMLLMGAAATAAHVGKPTLKLADQLSPLNLEDAFPSEFGSWQIDRRMPVILPAPDVQAKLDAIYNKVLSRTYVDLASGERIMLSVAYGGDQSDGMNIHLPEVCYPAQGFQLLSRQLTSVDAGDRRVPAVQIVTRLGGRVEPVTYWITVGDSVVPTRTQQKLTQIRYGLRGYIPDGMLVRVSSIGADQEAAFRLQRRFIGELAGVLPADTKDRIIGASAGARGPT